MIHELHNPNNNFETALYVDISLQNRKAIPE